MSEIKIKNPTVGTGDPYWYEWEVGLFYALDMLNPDSGIKYVQLQVTDAQKLDDVVVVYKDGSATRVQVKHTRVRNKFYFSDLVSATGRSLLLDMFAEWKDLIIKHPSCKVVIHSNKEPDSKTKPIFDEIKENLENKAITFSGLKAVERKKYSDDFQNLYAQLETVNAELAIQFLRKTRSRRLDSPY